MAILPQNNAIFEGKRERKKGKQAKKLQNLPKIVKIFLSPSEREKIDEKKFLQEIYKITKKIITLVIYVQFSETLLQKLCNLMKHMCVTLHPPTLSL